MPNEGSYEAAKRKSDEVHADLLVHPEKYTMLTGDRPTGRLHLGHYFGTLVDRVRLQDMGVRTNVIIADYQVITDRDTTEHATPPSTSATTSTTWSSTTWRAASTRPRR